MCQPVLDFFPASSSPRAQLHTNLSDTHFRTQEKPRGTDMATKATHSRLGELHLHP
jgi:hypothetical protein